MNRQAQGQEQEDFEFCACDVCMRELRRVAEKEALEAAAKQKLMVSLSIVVHRFPLIRFHPPAWGISLRWAGHREIDQRLDTVWHNIFLPYLESLSLMRRRSSSSTNFPSRLFPSDELNTDQIRKLLQFHGLNEEQSDVIRYRVSSGNVVHFGPGAEIKAVHLPSTSSINVTGIPLDRPHPVILKALKDALEECKKLAEGISVADVRRAQNSPHTTVTIHVGGHDPKKIMSKLDGAELFGRNVSSRLSTSSYPNQMEDISPTERNIVYIYWRSPEMTATATFKTSALAMAWCEEHDCTVIDGRTLQAKTQRTMMSRFRKIVEIGNLPLNVDQQMVRGLLPGATSISFQPRNDYDVERALARLRKDVETIAGGQLRDYREDKSRVPSGWMGIRIQLYTWHAAQSIRDTLTQRRRRHLSGHRLFVTLEEPYRFSVSIEPRQYQAQRRILHSIWDAHRDKPLAGVRIITCGSDQDVRVEVYGNNELAVGVLKVYIEGVLRGHLIPGCHTFFESNERLESIRNISVQTDCFIRLNAATETITAFGDDDTLRAFTEKLQLHVDHTISFKLELKSSTESAFYLRRGIPLLASVVGEGNICITLEHPHPILTVRGGGDEMTHLLQWLCNENIEDIETSTVPPDTACPVCLDYPEAPIRLECGAFYCYPCLRHFLITGITDKNPVLACVECLMPIPVNILRKILPRSDLEDLFELVFNTHVRTNPEKFKFCGTPHCTRLYMLSPKDSVDPPAFHCPSCLRSVCSACQSVPHEGVTCFEWEINQNAEVQKADALLEKWASRKGKDVHRCPKCNALIEKNKGCNHIRCHCGAHLCWICIESFPDADAVYTHLRQTH